MHPILPALVSLSVFLASCVGTQVIPIKEPTPKALNSRPASHSSKWEKADSLWELRADPKTAVQSLVAFRSAFRKHKKDPELSARLSQACYFVATFVENSPAKRDRLFREGQTAAQAGMMTHPGYAAKYVETGDEIEAARELDIEFVANLYWYVVNLGRELNQEGVIVRRGNRGRLESLNNHLLFLDETFNYAGPHRVAAVIPTRLPEGDMKKSKVHFEKAIAMAPLYLGNRVAFADFYAIRAKDKKLFMDQLTQVIAISADTVPAIGPENRIAQAQAKALLERADELFP